MLCRVDAGRWFAAASVAVVLLRGASEQLHEGAVKLAAHTIAHNQRGGRQLLAQAIIVRA